MKPAMLSDSRERLVIAAVILTLLLLPVLPLPTFVVRVATLIFIYSVVNSGLNLLIGYCGLLSVAQAGFFGIGAYTAALMSIHLHTSFLINVVAGTAITGVSAALLGLPILRLKGQYLVMATLGINQVISLIASNARFTGGPNGLPGISPPSFLGMTFSHAASLYYLNLAGFVLVTVVVILLVNSPIGRAMTAVREDELAAESIGINTGRTKALAFSVAAAIAGMAGVFYAHNGLYVSWQTFAPGESFTMLAMLTIGGMGTLWGPFLGTALLMALPEMLRSASMYRFFLYGLALCVVTPLWPGGLAGIRLLRPRTHERLGLQRGKAA